MLELCYNNFTEEIQVGVDEAGRGSLFGSIYVAAVVWNPEIDPLHIKDSKKLNKTNRKMLKTYIEENAYYYTVKSIDAIEIDKINILEATMKAMHQCIKEINDIITVDRLLIDGNYFKPYHDRGVLLKHHCITSGDNKFVSIAAASILAKTYHDEHIMNMCDENESLDIKYSLRKNMGYGTKEHIDGIKCHGLSQNHRKTFCKNFYTINI